MKQPDRNTTCDSYLRRAGMLLLLVGSICSLGLIAQKQPLSNPPASQVATLPALPKTPTATDLVRTGDEFMLLQRESNVGRLHDLAEKDYRAALALDPTHADALLGLAWVHSTRHNFTAASDYARQALRINPRLQTAYSLLSDAAVELGNYDEAFQHCQAALDLAPNLTSYSRAAHLLWLTGAPQQAHALMQKAIKSGGTRPEHIAWCRVELAQMHLQAGNIAAAEQEATLALRELPRHPRMLLTMGRIKAAKEEFTAAEQFYERALKIEPSHDVLLALGDLQLRQSRRTEAEKTFQRLIQLHTLDSTHPAQLARFYADHDRRLPEALAAAEAAHRESKSIYVLDTLAWCLHKNGQHAKAKSVIQEALKWHTPDASILYHAGMIHSQLGDKQSSRQYLSQALQRNPLLSPFEAANARQELARNDSSE